MSNERPAGDAVSRVLAAEVRYWRLRRGWTEADLAERMTELGCKWHQSTVSTIESPARPPREDGRRTRRRTRTVSVDELSALSVALLVPAQVLMYGVGRRSTVSLAPQGVRPVHPYAAILWNGGQEPPPDRFLPQRGAWWKDGIEAIQAFEQLEALTDRTNRAFARWKNLERAHLDPLPGVDPPSTDAVETARKQYRSRLGSLAALRRQLEQEGMHPPKLPRKPPHAESEHWGWVDDLRAALAGKDTSADI